MRLLYQRYETWMVNLIDQRHQGQQQLLLPAIAVFLMATIGGFFSFLFSLVFVSAAEDSFFWMFLFQVFFSVVFLISFVQGWVSLKTLIFIFVFSNSLFTSSVAFADGGLDSPFLPWLSLAPFVSFLLMGYRGFVVWGGVAIGLFILFVFQPRLLPPPPPIPNQSVSLYSYTGLYLAEMLTVGLIVWVRRRSERTARQLDANFQARQDLEKARSAGAMAEREQILSRLREHLSPRLEAVREAQKKWFAEMGTPVDGANAEFRIGAIQEEAERIVQDHPRPPDAAENLQNAITGLADELRRGLGIMVELRVPAQPLMPMTPGNLHLFRIVQEACRNIARHAQAKKVRIFLHSDDDQLLRLEIHDDGIGFHPQSTLGQGLQNMKDRVAMMGGRFSLDTAPGRGTRIFCDFQPLMRPMS